MEFGLQGRVAIVTGASRGMGFAVAQALAREGAKVLMVARNAEALSSAANGLRESGCEVDLLAGDVADSALPTAVVERCHAKWGGVHILVNNAGGPPMGTAVEHGPEAWEGAIQTNLLSVVRFCTAVAPIMREQKWGRIVSITSTVAKEPSPAMVLSATARAGVAAFSKALAIDLAPFNVTVNVVCPGGVLTDRLRDLLRSRAARENRDYDDLLRESQAAIPAKRFAEPVEIANVIAFLASSAGAYVNGVSLSVDGALTRGLT